jgi:WD40 repeat protein
MMGYALRANPSYHLLTRSADGTVRIWDISDVITGIVDWDLF